MATTTPATTTNLTLNNLANINATNFAVSVTGGTVNALLSDSDTRILQNPRIRATDGQRATLKIGSNRDTSDFFKGTIDEVHIWSRALSASEIATLAAIGYPRAQLIWRALGETALLCFFGWLLGGGTPSPLRKAWLKLRLGPLEREEKRQTTRKKPRPNPGGLRVLPGGRVDDDDDKGPDGRWLN